MPEGSSSDTDSTATAPRRPTWRRVVLWTALALCVVLVAAVGTAYGYYTSLRNGMAEHDIGASLDDEERPPKLGEDVTILLIGSDGRDDDNADYGYFEGERSDSLMLAHISPTQERVTAINFPRDSLVQLPECDPYEGTEGTSGYYGMINAALFHGGPPCVVRTIESLTGIRVDHMVHIDFVGFRDMVDAVGGVDICVPEPLRDERAKLDIDAGEQTLDGEEALAFVRARYEIGDGSDAGRIDRQQMFLAAFADQVLSSDVLSRPSQLLPLLEAVSEHVGVDSDLGLDRMASIATTTADLDLRDINFYTVPSWPAPGNPNRVIWNEAKAEVLFEAVAGDEPIDESLLIDADPESRDAPEEAGEEDEEQAPSPSFPAEVEPEESPAAAPDPSEAIERRDATADPCAHGLGTGTEGAQGWG